MKHITKNIKKYYKILAKFYDQGGEAVNDVEAIKNLGYDKLLDDMSKKEIKFLIDMAGSPQDEIALKKVYVQKIRAEKIDENQKNM